MTSAEPPAFPVPATPEMMQLVRDEHDLVADMIKAQLAAERDRLNLLVCRSAQQLPQNRSKPALLWVRHSA